MSETTKPGIPGITATTKIEISNHWNLGFFLANEGADWEQVDFLHGFMEGMLTLPTVQWSHMAEAAKKNNADLSELASMMSEYFGEINE